jgi:hypothetical protein
MPTSVSTDSWGVSNPIRCGAGPPGSCCPECDEQGHFMLSSSKSSMMPSKSQSGSFNVQMPSLSSSVSS